MSPEQEPEQPAPRDAGVPQQDVLSPAVRRRLQQCFERATKLAAKGDYDFDYASTLLTECVVKDPGNLVYVEAFLDNLQRKYNNNKKGAWFKGFGGKSALRKAVAANDWAQVLQLGPEVLQSNPWDVFTLRSLARACEAHQYNEVELRYLKTALDVDLKEPEVNRHCARSLARMGQFDQAIFCWHRVQEAKRDDPEAPKMISALAIEKNRARAGFADEQEKAPAARGKAAPAKQPQTPAEPPDQAAGAEVEPQAPAKRREIPLTPRQKLEQALVNDPGDLDAYLQLAQLHLDEERYADAERVLRKALAASAGDVRIRERLEDAKILRMRHQVAVAEKQAAGDPSPQLQELAQQLRSDLNRLELEIYNSRSERYPADKELRHQLGLRLKRAGNFGPAVEQFQQAAEDPPHQLAATIEMGECWRQLKQYPKALQCYQAAAELAAQPAQSGYKALSLYRAGVLAAALNDLESAEKHLSELVRLDPHYRDAADRLDKIRQIRDKA